jgi:membrane-bound lytic murein transglycosylase D
MLCRSIRLNTVAVFVLASMVPAAARPAGATALPYPDALRPQVEFWKTIFGVYSEHQIVVHDTDHLGRVYSVLDFRADAQRGTHPVVLERMRHEGVEREKARVRSVLLRLDAKGAGGNLTREERAIAKLFAGNKDPRRFAKAADPARIRTQRGLKERFREGVRISRSYLPTMERIFKQEGLPVELTRLPLVESCFNVNAYSKVGAAGIWQFMPATGRRFLHISGDVDERRDPLRATHAAARYLRQNYQLLGTWPLAITAYNHGEGGVRKAVRELGTTDIGRIVHEYRGPRFGFASRNFYAEFLAAQEVERAYRSYFGDLTFYAPFHGEEVRLPHAVSSSVAARCAGVQAGELAALNPAVDSGVFHRNRNLPAGYVLRVPAGGSNAFEERLAKVPVQSRAVIPPRAHTHEVASGQTLSTIAARYRVSVSALQRANGLRGSTIRRGQTLKIPSGGAPSTASGAVQRERKAAARTHRVAKGQTLSQLASRYGVSVREIQRANGLRGSNVRVGQVLKIPAS